MVESAEQILMTDSAELTMMIKALRKELMDKTLMVAKLEGMTSSPRLEHNYGIQHASISIIILYFVFMEIVTIICRGEQFRDEWC